jgi:hypothetical protein
MMEDFSNGEIMQPVLIARRIPSPEWVARFDQTRNSPPTVTLTSVISLEAGEQILLKIQQ